MRKAPLVAAIAVTLVALASVPSSAAVRPATATTRTRVNSQFATLARTLPPCGTQTTNCRYGTAATSLQASVESPTATIYFEMRSGVLTDLEVYAR